MKREQLSTIEHTVLGIVWQFGPCTTYAVMRELSTSNSTYYRNRAGTTYPTVERLVRSGLLRYVGDEIGTRKDRLIEVTAAGVSRLQLWLEPPVPTEEVGLSRDLLRLRVYFLGALEPGRRAEFLRESLAALRSYLKECEAAAENHKKLEDPFIALADLGAVHETKARIAWIEEITPAILGLDR